MASSISRVCEGFNFVKRIGRSEVASVCRVPPVTERNFFKENMSLGGQRLKSHRHSQKAQETQLLIPMAGSLFHNAPVKESSMRPHRCVTKCGLV